MEDFKHRVSTIIRGEVGGNNGGKGVRVFRKKYKGHMYKTNRGWNQGREVEMAGVEGSGGRKMQTTVLEQQ